MEERIQSHTGLFRQEALQNANQTMLGKVMIIPKPSVLMLGTLTVGITALMIWWLTTATFARHVSVSGWLEPVSGTMHYYSNQPNQRLTQVLVQKGMQVDKGQPLLVMENMHHIGTGQHSYLALTESMHTQRSAIQSEIHTLQQAHAIELQHLHYRFQQVAEQIIKLDSIIESVVEQLNLAKAARDRMNRLHSAGWVTQIDKDRAQQSWLELQTQLAQAEREKLTLNAELEHIQQNIESSPLELAQSQQRLNRELASLDQQRLRVESEFTTVIVASAPGMVNDIYIKEGQTTDVNKPLITVSEIDQSLTAKLTLPSYASGFVRTGQAVNIKYDAYPFEKYGMHAGVINNISDSVLLPGEITHPANQVNDPVYLVDVELASDLFWAEGQHMPLKSGMTLTADVTLGERTLLEWLLAPIYALKGRV